MSSSKGRHFTPEARAAAIAARRAKAAEPKNFGLPELFVVRAEGQTYTWELRRFGGVLLRRGVEAFVSMSLARTAGMLALDDALD